MAFFKATKKAADAGVMHNKKIQYNLLNSTLFIMLLIFALSGCKAEDKIIHLEKISDVPVDYNLSQIVNAISKESNKLCLACFFKNENHKGVFLRQKVIDSAQGKREVANWFKNNFDLISSIPQTIPKSERNRAVRPPFEFCIFSGESPWKGYRFSLWYEDKLNNKEFKKLSAIFINEGKVYK